MEGQPALPTAHPVLSLRAALSCQGPPVHPRAGPKCSVMCFEGIRGKSGGIAHQHSGGYSRGTLQAVKWSPWCWHKASVLGITVLLKRTRTY